MTYEYVCRVCQHEFEIEQKITEEPLLDCPKCLVAALKRLISGGSGFILEGNGWANDGYASVHKNGSKE